MSAANNGVIGGKRRSHFCFKVAERTGLEPATPGVTGRYSNQLNYRSGVGALKAL